ncbi:MAG: DUF5362 family protein [Candidatus Eisenbacteria bacterium]|nr:DUF5362 family protein [Candidatus Eisenbacteria bacterium]
MEENLQDGAVSVREISLPIYESKGWIKFIGVLSIIQGLAAALTVVGIVIAWLPIWVGVLLMQCASSIERARTSGDKASLVRALDKLRTYFAIQGILTLVSLIVVVVAFSMGVLGAIFGLLSGWH